MKLSLVAAAAALLLCAAPARGQDMVAAHLDSAAMMVGMQGFVPMGEAIRGSLPAGQQSEYQLRTERGMRYVILGVCDNACTDLDLALMNRRGLDVAVDRAADDVPVLSVLADESDRFWVRVEMAACAAETCEYGVRIFQSRVP